MSDLLDRMSAEYATMFSADNRHLLASRGEARPDGSYPIRNALDLGHAINDYARTGADPSVRAWIVKRAAALGLTESLPPNWKAS